MATLRRRSGVWTTKKEKTIDLDIIDLMDYDLDTEMSTATSTTTDGTESSEDLGDDSFWVRDDNLKRRSHKRSRSSRARISGNRRKSSSLRESHIPENGAPNDEPDEANQNDNSNSNNSSSRSMKRKSRSSREARRSIKRQSSTETDITDCEGPVSNYGLFQLARDAQREKEQEEREEKEQEEQREKEKEAEREKEKERKKERKSNTDDAWLQSVDERRSRRQSISKINEKSPRSVANDDEEVSVRTKRAQYARSICLGDDYQNEFWGAKPSSILTSSSPSSASGSTSEAEEEEFVRSFLHRNKDNKVIMDMARADQPTRNTVGAASRSEKKLRRWSLWLTSSSDSKDHATSSPGGKDEEKRKKRFSFGLRTSSSPDRLCVPIITTQAESPPSAERKGSLIMRKSPKLHRKGADQSAAEKSPVLPAKRGSARRKSKKGSSIGSTTTLETVTEGVTLSHEQLSSSGISPIRRRGSGEKVSYMSTTSREGYFPTKPCPKPPSPHTSPDSSQSDTEDDTKSSGKKKPFNLATILQRGSGIVRRTSSDLQRGSRVAPHSDTEDFASNSRIRRIKTNIMIEGEHLQRKRSNSGSNTSCGDSSAESGAESSTVGDSGSLVLPKRSTSRFNSKQGRKERKRVNSDRSHEERDEEGEPDREHREPIASSVS